LPSASLPAQTWVGAADGPYYCLQGEARRDEPILAAPHRLLPSGVLQPAEPAVELDAFTLPLLAVEIFDASRPWASTRATAEGDAAGERPYLLGMLTDQPGSRRGWFLGKERLLHFATRKGTQRLVELAYCKVRQEAGQPAQLPVCPAIWGQGLLDLDARHTASARQRALGHEEERGDWVIFQGYAWERAPGPRPPPTLRVHDPGPTPRDFTADPLAEAILAHPPEWAYCWKDLRDTSLPRTHRSTVYLLLQGVLTLNGEAFFRHSRDAPWCPHSCCDGPGVLPDARPVETISHAFLECPLARAVMTWLTRLMAFMDGEAPPASAAVLLLGNPAAWRPRNANLAWVWLHLRVACLHHLFHHREMVGARGHPSSPFAVVGAVVSDLAVAFHMDLHRVSHLPLRMPGMCADWLRGGRRLTQDIFNSRWLHAGLASRDAPEPPRFRLSVHFPVPLATCIPAGFVFY
jgi:hypothetical protein